jgi:sugar O-acyltransferase (sialic acid O-acetyltransferase NeuD family)
MQNELIIYGASGHGKVILDCIQSNEVTDTIYFIDDTVIEDEVNGIPVVPKNQIHAFEDKKLIIAVGSNFTRRYLAMSIQPIFITVIHASATVSKFAQIDIGTVLMPQVVVNAGVQIGKHCIINSAAVVEHDCLIEDFCHIAPKAALAGNVKVGEGTHIGIGAIVIQGVKIGKWATIGAGSVVIRDVPDYAVIVGNPGKTIKYNSFENIH